MRLIVKRDGTYESRKGKRSIITCYSKGRLVEEVDDGKRLDGKETTSVRNEKKQRDEITECKTSVREDRMSKFRIRFKKHTFVNF